MSGRFSPRSRGVRRSLATVALLSTAAAAARAQSIPASCLEVLTSSCSTDAAKAHSPFASQPCPVCCGHLQQKLRTAGCSHHDLVHYCDTPRGGWPKLLPPIEIARHVDMPVTSVGHPDKDCSWKGVGPGCDVAQNMTEMWLRLGGRGIDTAADYGPHQAQVGAAVRAMVSQGVVRNRTDVFITTKISPDTCSAEAAVAAVRADLTQLGLSHVDLVLQHFPCDTDAENQARKRKPTTSCARPRQHAQYT